MKMKYINYSQNYILSFTVLHLPELFPRLHCFCYKLCLLIYSDVSVTLQTLTKFPVLMLRAEKGKV